MNSKIIYFGDPLCSWCYGFEPEISKVKASFRDIADFQLVMGGLRPFGTEKISDLKSFLGHHWEEVHNKSGQEFRHDILDDSDFVYDTEPPSRAVVAMRSLNPAGEFEFFKQVQRLFYFQNKNTNNVENYVPLLKEMNVKKDDFIRVFEDDHTRNQTREDFSFARKAGISAFPTTVLKFMDLYYLLARGYVEAKELSERINEVMEDHHEGEAK